MRIGAHVSTAGGVAMGIERARDLGAETIQIFGSSPRAWAFKRPADDEAARFRAMAAEAGVSPVFLHGIYLVNLGGPEELVARSVASLIEHMALAADLGAAGVIFHTGSHKGAGFDAVLDQVTSALRRVLADTPENTWLVLENSAGAGSHIGASFVDLGRLMQAVDDPRLRLCLDTQHAFAAGYDLSDAGALDRAMAEVDRHVGLARLVAVHANDARSEEGSGVDRHENIGEGHIGMAGFEVIMAHPAFRDVPFVLEVPGFDGSGPDKVNVDRLKRLRRKLGIPGAAVRRPRAARHARGAAG